MLNSLAIILGNALYSLAVALFLGPAGLITGSYRLNPARAELMYYPVFHGRNEMKKCGVAEAQEAR